MKIIVQLLLLFLPLHALAAAPETPYISVIGVAEKEISPDELRWGLSVKTEGPTAKEVSEKHVEEVSDVLTLLYELGQTKESVSTTNMQLTEQWVYRNNSREKKGYFASTTISYTSTDFGAYVDYWTRLAALKNVSISRAVFGVSKRSEIEDEVKVDAIAAAREKAARFAGALGSKIGEPLRIEEFEDGNVFSRGPARAALMENDAGGQPVSPGKQLIRAQIRVHFSLQ